MSQYLDRTTEWFEWLQSRVQNTENPHHRAILQNYLDHAALELYGTWDLIFTPEMTVDEPEYNIYGFGYDKLTTFSGNDEVKGWYSQLNQAGAVLTYPYGPYDKCLEVFDYGFVTFMMIAPILSGKDLAESGVEVDDESAAYLAEAPSLNRWWYDEKARLIGEDVYQFTEMNYTKIAPEDYVTVDEVREVAKRFLPS